jgi:hypothetical protein
MKSADSSSAWFPFSFPIDFVEDMGNGRDFLQLGIAPSVLRPKLHEGDDGIGWVGVG